MAPPNASATRQAILRAATTLFLEKGVAATSISGIARAAGVTKSLIHHHFETKDKLWLAVRDSLFADYAQLQDNLLRGMSNEPTIEIFLRSLEEYFRYLIPRPEFLILLTMFSLEELRDEHPTPIDERSIGNKLFHVGVDITRRAQAAKSIRNDLDPAFIVLSGIMLAESWFVRQRTIITSTGVELPVAHADRHEWFLNQFLPFMRAALSPEAQARTATESSIQPAPRRGSQPSSLSAEPAYDAEVTCDHA